MITQLRSLIPIGFFASLAAPLVYTCYVVATTVINGRVLDIPLLATIFISSLGFSLIISEIIVLFVVGVASVFRRQEINVLLVAALSVVGLSALIAVMVGIKQAVVFFILSTANAIVFVVLSRKARGRESSPRRSD